MVVQTVLPTLKPVYQPACCGSIMLPQCHDHIACPAPDPVTLVVVQEALPALKRVLCPSLRAVAPHLLPVETAALGSTAGVMLDCGLNYSASLHHLVSSCVGTSCLAPALYFW